MKLALVIAFLSVLLGHTAAVVQNGDTVCAEGFIMDNYCILREKLLDRNVKTLEKPNLHSYHCLLDVTSCYNSLFSILGDPAACESTYTVDYGFNQASTDLLLNLGRATGKKGYCSTCETTDGPEYGFRAGIKGVIIDSSANPPLVNITELAATDGSEDYCDSEMQSPNQSSSEDEEECCRRRSLLGFCKE